MEVSGKDLATLLLLLSQTHNPFDSLIEQFNNSFLKKDHFLIRCSLLFVLQEVFLSFLFFFFFVSFLLFKYKTPPQFHYLQTLIINNLAERLAAYYLLSDVNNEKILTRSPFFPVFLEILKSLDVSQNISCLKEFLVQLLQEKTNVTNLFLISKIRSLNLNSIISDIVFFFFFFFQDFSTLSISIYFHFSFFPEISSPKY